MERKKFLKQISTREIMSAARPSSTSDSDSTSTDSEMPLLVAVAWAPEEEPREPHIQRRSNGSEVDALADETIEGLFEATKQKSHLMWLLNSYLRRYHGVSIARIGADQDGILTIVVNEKLPAPRRRCRWDRHLWTLSETMEWALMNRHATIRWAINFWERDFEP